MNWIDILGCWSSFVGAVRMTAGFARVGVSFIATILGIFSVLVLRCSGCVCARLCQLESDRKPGWIFRDFHRIVLIGAVVGRLLAKFFKWVGLSWFDRILGGAFGLVRGIVMAAALITVLLAFAPQPPPRSVVESKTMPYVIDASNIMAALTPREVKEAFQATKDKVKKIWSEQTAKPAPELRHE